jgi:hypothetical protein
MAITFARWVWLSRYYDGPALALKARWSGSTDLLLPTSNACQSSSESGVRILELFAIAVVAAVFRLLPTG